MENRGQFLQGRQRTKSNYIQWNKNKNYRHIFRNQASWEDDEMTSSKCWKKTENFVFKKVQLTQEESEKEENQAKNRWNRKQLSDLYFNSAILIKIILSGNSLKTLVKRLSD